MRHCTICLKGSQMQGKRKLLRGHYNPVNWTRKYPNLQQSRVLGVRMLICTQCMKTLSKTRIHKATATASVPKTAATAA